MISYTRFYICPVNWSLPKYLIRASGLDLMGRGTINQTVELLNADEIFSRATVAPILCPDRIFGAYNDALFAKTTA